MIRDAKWQGIAVTLIGIILVYGLIWSGLFSTTGEPNQGKVLSLDPVRESPLRDGASHPAPSPLWQSNQSNIAFLQIVPVISPNSVIVKNTGNVRGALYHRYQNTNSSSAITSFRIIDSPKTVFQFISGQTYQELDIPPPHTSAPL